jgi:protein involved in polysaccharide export with SLBB domain
MLCGDLSGRPSSRAVGVLAVVAAVAAFAHVPFCSGAAAQQGRSLEHLRTLELTGSRQGASDLLGRGMYRPELGSPEAIAVEGTIDPASYQLAPGDELALAIWGATDLILRIQVAADGSLVVPSVGALNVGGMTLRDAENMLRGRCAGPYPDSDISLTLVRPGLMRIPVTGMIAMPGVYAVFSTYRLSDLIELAGGLRDGADSRGILIHDRDDREHSHDILAWRTGLDPGGNPRLRSGDRVHAPHARDAYRVRGILPSSEDETPVRSSVIDRPFEPHGWLIPARPGDTLGFILSAVGAMSPRFCSDGVWVRPAEGGEAAEGPRWVPLAEADAYTMTAGEIVEIPFCQEWIAVGGSVTRPGLYPFLPGATVADYVYAAGGPNEFGRQSGWQLVHPGDTKRRSAAPSDTVSAGSRVWVPERRAYTISTLLTPIGSAVAVFVSILALTR